MERDPGRLSSAMSGRSPGTPNFSCDEAVKDSFPATNLSTASARPGQERTIANVSNPLIRIPDQRRQHLRFRRVRPLRLAMSIAFDPAV